MYYYSNTNDLNLFFPLKKSNIISVGDINDYGKTGRGGVMEERNKIYNKNSRINTRGKQDIIKTILYYLERMNQEDLDKMLDYLNYLILN